MGILVFSLTLIMIMSVAPRLGYAQEDPFTVGSPGDPFEVGGGYSLGSAQSNTTLQIRSDTDWSGNYGDSTGSTTVDGHGNKDILFSCSGTYSADFQKKGIGPGFLRLNIVQKESHSVPTPSALLSTLSYPSIEPGKSVNLTRRITDLVDPIQFQITQQATSGEHGRLLFDQPFNSTLLATIMDPNGKIMARNDTSGDISGNYTSTLKPDIAGNYTFAIKNIGNSPIDLWVYYGSSASPTTEVTTNNMTNTRTTTAQFGTVSVIGSC